MQNQHPEYVLATIPGDSPRSRIVFASRSQPGKKPILLKQESYSDAVGWFVQNSIELTREEMVALRSAMGGQAPSACQRTQLRTAANLEPSRILSFEQAAKRTASA